MKHETKTTIAAIVQADTTASPAQRDAIVNALNAPPHRALDLITAEAVAKICKVSVRTVRRWAAQGHIRAIRQGPRAIRFARDEIEAFALGQSAESPADQQ